MVPAVLVEEGDDGFDVVLLDDVENLRALDEHAVQHLQNTCGSTVQQQLPALFKQHLI